MSSLALGFAVLPSLAISALNWGCLTTCSGVAVAAWRPRLLSCSVPIGLSVQLPRPLSCSLLPLVSLCRGHACHPVLCSHWSHCAETVPAVLLSAPIGLTVRRPRPNPALCPAAVTGSPFPISSSFLGFCLMILFDCSCWLMSQNFLFCCFSGCFRVHSKHL